jgi:hypothetical protein
MELVELEEPSEKDLADVRLLIEEHGRRTGSDIAQRVLDDWDSLRGAWVKVMPMDYKRALREQAEKASVDAGEPAVVAEHGDGDGTGPVRAGQGATYPPGNGRGEAREPGEAGQTEDAAKAAERAGNDAERRGASDAERAQIEEEAEEEVLPSGG